MERDKSRLNIVVTRTKDVDEEHAIIGVRKMMFTGCIGAGIGRKGLKHYQIAFN